tara:strand:+ start:306 stop:1082 length:777 start_codon:yes stop_codon:yes gene_type:complete
MIIDSHCHLLHEKYNVPIHTIIENARSNGVKQLLNISTREEEFSKCIELSKNYKDIFCSLGVHPHETNNLNDFVFKKIIKLSNCENVIGIGETGLDFYYQNSDKKNQINSFIEHIKISQETNLPLIIHMRNAEEDMLRIIEKHFKQKEFKGLIHCFTGSKHFAERLLSLNFYFSISGIITFKNSDILRNTVKNIPLKNVLVETDSPYLTPEPLRGRINEPSFIIHTVEYMSKLFKISVEEMSNNTTNNFYKLFKKANK